MVDVKNKDYIVIVQCHIVKERCSGYNCDTDCDKYLRLFNKIRNPNI
jgi:hypothetical protein